jgi:hypothetical protein
MDVLKVNSLVWDVAPLTHRVVFMSRHMYIECVVKRMEIKGS